MPDFDLVVIGAGAAGLSVTAGAAQLGMRVALIERGRMGGDCLNIGCVPSKAVLAISRKVRGGEVVAWQQVRDTVAEVIAAIAPMDSVQRYEALGATVVLGEARFVDPGVVAVNGRTITARRFVVAAGSRAAVPAIPGLDRVAYWTNESLFNLSEKPDHLLILGGGPIGLEMADAFAGLGCRVTLVESGRIAGHEDPELADGLRLALAARGVGLRERALVTGIAAGPVLTLADGTRIAGSHLLVATGRTPNLAALGLAAGGVRASERGIVTDRGLRSVSNRRVFAAGDIADPVGIGPRAFTHVCSYHASLLIRRLVFRLPARLDYAALPRAIYTDPELAQTGMTEAEARAAGLKVSVLRWSMQDNDRAVAERDTAGMVKLVVRRGRVVGAGILAPHAGEMISLWSLAIARRVKLAALAGLVVPYPTRSEAGKRAAGRHFAASLFSDRTRALVRLLSRLP